MFVGEKIEFCDTIFSKLLFICSEKFESVEEETPFEGEMNIQYNLVGEFQVSDGE